MRPNRTAIVALVLAAGTALGLAAPAGAQAARPAATCKVCRIVIYTGAGSSSKDAVGPATLPALDAAPKTITAGADTLKFAVADLQGKWGACKSDCSDWDYTASPTQVYVSSFTVNGVPEHALQSVGIYSPPTYWVQDPNNLGAGVWTPICLQWQGGSIKLDTKTYKWSVESC